MSKRTYSEQLLQGSPASEKKAMESSRQILQDQNSTPQQRRAAERQIELIEKAQQERSSKDDADPNRKRITGKGWNGNPRRLFGSGDEMELPEMDVSQERMPGFFETEDTVRLQWNWMMRYAQDQDSGAMFFYFMKINGSLPPSHFRLSEFDLRRGTLARLMKFYREFKSTPAYEELACLKHPDALCDDRNDVERYWNPIFTVSNDGNTWKIRPLRNEEGILKVKMFSPRTSQSANYNYSGPTGTMNMAAFEKMLSIFKTTMSKKRKATEDKKEGKTIKVLRSSQNEIKQASVKTRNEEEGAKKTGAKEKKKKQPAKKLVAEEDVGGMGKAKDPPIKDKESDVEEENDDVTDENEFWDDMAGRVAKEVKVGGSVAQGVDVADGCDEEGEDEEEDGQDEDDG